MSVTSKIGRLCLVVTAVALIAQPLTADQVFRSTMAQISVSASVKKGNNVVSGLTASDFTVMDNGVPQVVEALSMESVPVDVTLFLDTSGSTAGKLDDIKKDVQGIIELLGKGDRFRLLTIGDSVYESVPWVAAGTKVQMPFQPVGGISLIHDALLLALMHRVDLDRRHLVVGLTDSLDCGSIASSQQLRELASRSEAVIHLIEQSGGGGESHYRVRTCTPRARPNGDQIIREAIERTGGELHTGSWFFRSASILRQFKKIFEDFRQSYVLRYAATGVAIPGWHAITVQVPGKKDVTVRARAGYYGS